MRIFLCFRRADNFSEITLPCLNFFFLFIFLLIVEGNDSERNRSFKVYAEMIFRGIMILNNNCHRNSSRWRECWFSSSHLIVGIIDDVVIFLPRTFILFTLPGSSRDALVAIATKLLAAAMIKEFYLVLRCAYKVVRSSSRSMIKKWEVISRSLDEQLLDELLGSLASLIERRHFSACFTSCIYHVEHFALVYLDFLLFTKRLFVLMGFDGEERKGHALTR